MRWWLALICLVWLGCKVNDPPPVTETWTDSFDRDRIGFDYYKTGKGYELVDGALSARGAHNHPLWLRKKLPRDVRIELDCWSNEDRGDIKIELFGDGHSYDPDGGRYMASGYEIIFGGWYNSKSIIARLDEHGKDLAERVEPKVVAKRRYHWKIERQGQKVTWWVESPKALANIVVDVDRSHDGPATPFLVYDDPHPLEGPGHEYVGFNNWETDTWFDNLVVTPL